MSEVDCKFFDSISSRDGIYVLLPQIMVGSVTTLTNRIWQKDTVTVSGFRPYEILSFLFLSFETLALGDLDNHVRSPTTLLENHVKSMRLDGEGKGP